MTGSPVEVQYTCRVGCWIGESRTVTFNRKVSKEQTVRDTHMRLETEGIGWGV